MSEHYFSENPTSASHPATATFGYRGQEFTCQTDAGVFSRGELDNGTRVLLSALPEHMTGRVLDLGCGWGAIGVCVAQTQPECSLIMSDVNSRALELSRTNLQNARLSAELIQSDGFEQISGYFDYILTNPPIRAGKETIYRLFAQSAAHLTEKGALYLVIRKQQGAPSALRYLETLFTQTNVVKKSGGYWVIRCKNEGGAS